MPIKYKYDPDRNIIYEKGVGEVTHQDLINYDKHLLSVPIKPGFKDLADYRNAQINIASEEMWRIKRMSDDLVKKLGGAKLAIVVDDGLGFGLARMYTMTSDQPGFQAMVFKTVAEACAWLEIDEPEGEIV